MISVKDFIIEFTNMIPYIAEVEVGYGKRFVRDKSLKDGANFKSKLFKKGNEVLDPTKVSLPIKSAYPCVIKMEKIAKETKKERTNIYNLS